MENKKIVERYYFAEEEHAEFGYTEDTVGYQKFVDEKVVSTVGHITEWWVDKLSEERPDGTIIDTNVGLPAYVKKEERKRRTKGDKISEAEAEDLNKEKL